MTLPVDDSLRHRMFSGGHPVIALHFVSVGCDGAKRDSTEADSVAKINIQRMQGVVPFRTSSQIEINELGRDCCNVIASWRNACNLDGLPVYFPPD